MYVCVRERKKPQQLTHERIQRWLPTCDCPTDVTSSLSYRAFPLPHYLFHLLIDSFVFYHAFATSLAGNNYYLTIFPLLLLLSNI